MMNNTNNIFPYFVGIHSLEEIATPDNRVVVMNILGNESRKVTPVSHAFSGGNVVAGVQYGRPGELENKCKTNTSKRRSGDKDPCITLDSC